MESSRFGSGRKSSPASDKKPVPDGLPGMNNLREEHEEKQRLEKANFDLKMKVYYLEENLKRYQDGEHADDVQGEHLKQENSKLKLMLEDKQVDLEQRNLLLIKSKNAIEALKVEIERLRAENSHQQDLEDRIRRLKQLNEDIESDYTAQIAQLEQQVQSARQLADVKEFEKVSSEDKVVRAFLRITPAVLTFSTSVQSHLEISFGQVNSHLKDALQEKRRLQESLSAAQHKIQALEDEATQSRAHVDLYRIQLEEVAAERDGFKDKLRQEQLAKLKAEEDGKNRLSDCTKHYESQIRTMRANHEHDVEKIRASNLEMLADVRDNYQAELARAKADLERVLGEVRSNDAQDLNRVKENFTVRYELCLLRMLAT
jgi:DNA repair exonuclease SbcCD ATPase subunit